jgi:hypothetical protein
VLALPEYFQKYIPVGYYFLVAGDPEFYDGILDLRMYYKSTSISITASSLEIRSRRMTNFEVFYFDSPTKHTIIKL